MKVSLIATAVIAVLLLIALLYAKAGGLHPNFRAFSIMVAPLFLFIHARVTQYNIIKKK